MLCQGVRSLRWGSNPSPWKSRANATNLPFQDHGTGVRSRLVVLEAGQPRQRLVGFALTTRRLYACNVRAQFWHTNTVESFFSIFKRGVYGCYFQVSETHLHRYAAEFDFRHNHRERLGYDDVQRADVALRGAIGKRLTYETTRSRLAGEPPF